MRIQFIATDLLLHNTSAYVCITDYPSNCRRCIRKEISHQGKLFNQIFKIVWDTVKVTIYYLYLNTEQNGVRVDVYKLSNVTHPMYIHYSIPITVIRLCLN